MNRIAPKGVVLLAAGSGSRLSPLTDNCHKSLLQVAGRPSLARAVDAVLEAGVEDVVVVTGHRRRDVEGLVLRHYSRQVRCVFNSHFEGDLNILSTELGVDHLRNPEAGYMIVETDLVMEQRAWRMILDVEDEANSFWATRGEYSATMTGGALVSDAEGHVIELAYRPHYDPILEGWQKLLGILYVGSEAVSVDRSTRQEAIGKSVAQYYMAPWVENLSRLPCTGRDLGHTFAMSFNDVHSYRLADAELARVSQG